MRASVTFQAIPTKTKIMESPEHLWAEAMRAERRGDAAAYECLLKEIADMLWLIQYRVTQRRTYSIMQIA
jgi:hypothetical protein